MLDMVFIICNVYSVYLCIFCVDYLVFWWWSLSGYGCFLSLWSESNCENAKQFPSNINEVFWIESWISMTTEFIHEKQLHQKLHYKSKENLYKVVDLEAKQSVEAQYKSLCIHSYTAYTQFYIHPETLLNANSELPLLVDQCAAITWLSEELTLSSTLSWSDSVTILFLCLFVFILIVTIRKQITCVWYCANFSIGGADFFLCINTLLYMNY